MSRYGGTASRGPGTAFRMRWPSRGGGAGYTAGMTVDDSRRLARAYLYQRRTIGVLGFLFPFVLAIGWAVFGPKVEIRNSISAYYGTGMRDIFVGFLFALGFFLIAYRGHDRHDNLVSHLAGTLALGVALFPTTHPSTAIKNTHFILAAILFFSLSYFCLVLFTRTREGEEPTEQKLKRNAVYRFCGWAMIVSIVLVGIYKGFLTGTWLSSLKPTFWLEALALVFFGFSWFVKGETLWKDVNSEGRSDA